MLNLQLSSDWRHASVFHLGCSVAFRGSSTIHPFGSDRGDNLRNVVPNGQRGVLEPCVHESSSSITPWDPQPILKIVVYSEDVADEGVGGRHARPPSGTWLIRNKTLWDPVG